MEHYHGLGPEFDKYIEQKKIKEDREDARKFREEVRREKEYSRQRTVIRDKWMIAGIVISLILGLANLLIPILS